MKTFSDPRKIISQLDLLGSHHVADFGSGAGFYTLALAEFMGPEGKIFAIDVQKAHLEKIARQAELKSFDSIHTLWADIEKEKGSRLRDNSIDVVIMANILFQLEHKNEALLEARRILKPEGRLLIVDWSESFGNLGPKTDHVVTEQTAAELCALAGFGISRHVEAGEHHYGFIATKTT